MIYTLENDVAILKVDTYACEIASFRRKDKDIEYMWNGDPAYWNRTSPVLFPFVGAVKDKKYRYEGKTYEMGQHGFARDMEFTLLGRLDDEIWMELTDTEETLIRYPFRFRLKIGYQLNGRDLTVAWRVENLNEKEMPFAIGAHPGFMMTRDENHVFRLYDRQGNLVDSIENRIFGTGGCITDRTEVINTPEGVLPITDHLFDGDALVIENEQLGSVELVKNGKTPLK